jgi:pantothenate synthetase
MIERRKDSIDELIDLKTKVLTLETIVDGLNWHHRNDKLQEQITALAKELAKEIDGVKARAGEQDRKALEKISQIALDIASMSAKLDLPQPARHNGNGHKKDTEARLRWMEKMMWGAVGAIAMFELLVRVWKVGG